MSTGIPAARRSHRCPSLAEQLCSAPQPWGPLLPRLPAQLRLSRSLQNPDASWSWILCLGASLQQIQWKNWRETLLTSVLLFLLPWQKSFQMVDRYWISVCLSHAWCKARLMVFYSQREHPDHLIWPPASHRPETGAVITPSFQQKWKNTACT